MKIGQKLFELRRKKNLSQEEVANLLNVSRQTISKWETDQSTPDFDKIAPLCELYQITTDELLTDKKVIKENVKVEEKNKKYLILIGSIFMYFISISWVVLAEETFALNEGILISVFLILLGVATSMLVYYSVSIPKKVIKNIPKPENKIVRQMNEILAILTTIIYLLISFITSAWHITWIIWIIYALLEEVMKLIFMIKGNHYES